MSVLSTCKSSFISLLLSLSLSLSLSLQKTQAAYISLLPASSRISSSWKGKRRDREGDQLAGQLAKSFRERKRDEKGQWRRDTHLPLPILSSHNAPHTFSPTSPFSLSRFLATYKIFLLLSLTFSLICHSKHFRCADPSAQVWPWVTSLSTHTTQSENERTDVYK